MKVLNRLDSLCCLSCFVSSLWLMFGPYPACDDRSENLSKIPPLRSYLLRILSLSNILIPPILKKLQIISRTCIFPEASYMSFLSVLLFLSPPLWKISAFFKEGAWISSYTSLSKASNVHSGWKKSTFYMKMMDSFIVRGLISIRFKFGIFSS